MQPVGNAPAWGSAEAAEAFQRAVDASGSGLKRKDPPGKLGAPAPKKQQQQGSGRAPGQKAAPQEPVGKAQRKQEQQQKVAGNGSVAGQKEQQLKQNQQQPKSIQQQTRSDQQAKKAPNQPAPPSQVRESLLLDCLLSVSAVLLVNRPPYFVLLGMQLVVHMCLVGGGR